MGQAVSVHRRMIMKNILKLLLCFIISLYSSLSHSTSSDAPLSNVTPAYPYAFLLFVTQGSLNCNGSVNGWGTYNVTSLIPPPTKPLACPDPYKLSIVAIPLIFWTNTTLLVSSFKYTNNQLTGTVECYGSDSTHKGTNQLNFTLMFYCINS